MSINALARAITQGGHNANLNLRVRRFHRRSRREERRFVEAMLADGECDARIDVEHAHWGYATMSRTGKDGPLARWLDAMAGRDDEEAHHRLCLADRRTARGRELIERAASRLRDDALPPRDRDSVRPVVRWSVRRKVADRCGDLFWKKRDGRLVPLTAEETERFHLLPGNLQRRLKGYHRSMDGKRRKDRPLPWQKRWRDRQIALGRDV